MPTVFPTPTSPPPNQNTMSVNAPSPPPPSRMNSRGSSSNLLNANAAAPSTIGASSTSHQVGTRQATRSRTRTRQAQPSNTNNVNNAAGPSRKALPRYNSEDHPLSPHKLAAKGYHQFHCLGVPFHVKKRYTFMRELGIGAYGCVALAHDSVLDCNVAIKKVTRIFEREVLARRALREVAVLREIGLCDNVTALLDFDTTFMEFNELYLVLEASEADLSQIIRSGQSLSDAHLQYFVAQILRGVRYMHAAKIIHRDMKPGNLLVNGDCQLKLCDFGLARAFRDTTGVQAMKDGDSPVVGERSFPESPHGDRSHPCSPSLHMTENNPTTQIRTTSLDFPGGPLTEYVATRWYRAPEIMLCFKKGYGPSIDIWSVGCILAELLGGKPIFAGKDYVDQIARINNVLGSPPKSTIEKIGSERARTYVESLPHMPKVPFAQLYPKANSQAIDLLEKMLCWDPEERISAADALHHPWLKAYHRSNNNWQPPRPFDRFEEVEMLNSIADFRVGLERESDEMRAELEALEAEELQAAEEMNARQQQSEQDSTDAHIEQDQTLTQDGSEGDLANSAARSSAPSRNTGSPTGSALITPSSISPSMNGISPTYETDLTSVSAPHSVAGSHSAGKRSRGVRAIDGLGLSSNNLFGRESENGKYFAREGACEALDKSLASHGLLCGDENELIRDAARSKTSFRRRAVSNAPSQLARLRRRGSEGSLRQIVRDAVSRSACEPVSTGTAPATVVGAEEYDNVEHNSILRFGGKDENSVEFSEGEDSDGAATAIQNALHNSTKTTDLIRRSPLQREEHNQVADDTSGLLTWLSLSSFTWAGRKRWWSGANQGQPSGNHVLANEGSDSTAIGAQSSGQDNNEGV
jgi:serine/threonine protein kinase